MHTASSVDFEPLNDATVRVVFYGREGELLNSQVVSPEVFEAMPRLAVLLEVAMKKGPAVAREIVRLLMVNDED